MQTQIHRMHSCSRNLVQKSLTSPVCAWYSVPTSEVIRPEMMVPSLLHYLILRKSSHGNRVISFSWLLEQTATCSVTSHPLLFRSCVFSILLRLPLPLSSQGTCDCVQDPPETSGYPPYLETFCKLITLTGCKH